MEEEINCGISQEEFEWFKNEYGEITPCQEYGDCEHCPWAESEVKE